MLQGTYANPSVSPLSLDQSNQPDSPNGKITPAVLLPLMPDRHFLVKLWKCQKAVSILPHEAKALLELFCLPLSVKGKITPVVTYLIRQNTWFHIGGSGLGRTDDFQKFCRFGSDSILRIKIGLGLKNLSVRSSLLSRKPVVLSVAYTENFHGGVIEWHMVVICIWCALYVMSQFDVIFMFPNQPIWRSLLK